jgi:Domain of unknown function (DUF397)
MFDMENEGPRFRAACEGGGSCVEVAQYAGFVLVRDSKDANSPVLAFTRAEWAEFVAGVKRDEFDLG